MNIIVCIKQVPEVMDVRLDNGSWKIVRDGVPSMINPFDLHAIEAAITIKELYGGKVTVLTMAPPQGEEAILEALAMGADRGVLLSDSSFSGADTLATSHTLARAIMKLEPFDLIICGTQTIDSGTAQVGAQIAEELELPYLSNVIRWEMEGDRLVIERSLDGFIETFDCMLPALITISRKANRPRYPSFASIERVTRAGEIIRWGINDLGVDRGEVGVSGSATIVKEVYEIQKRRKIKFLKGEPEEIVELLIKWMEERHLIE
jgi:electron transfer flavoprotein beta subunit